MLLDIYFLWCNAGIDYLSVASYDYLIPSHLVFLKDRVRKISFCGDSLCVMFQHWLLIIPWPF